jgi:sugar-specific transcriptional regulator TrmB
MKSMNESILQEAGLTQIEARVYLTLLEQGALLAGVISRKSGVHRRSVYDVMDRLIEKGLVSYIVKNNRRYYEATNPARLIELIREKQNAIERFLPELKSKYEARKEKQETLFFRGREGIKAVFDDQLQHKEILVLAATSYWNAVSKPFFAQYDLMRKKLKVKQRMIFSSNMRESARNIPLAEKRYLAQYETPVSMAIYGDKVSIIMWASSPFAILIKEKAIADAYRTYFETLWKIAKP